MNRRSFLKTSLAGALVLGASGVAYTVLRGDDRAPNAALDRTAHAAIAALVPAIVGNALPAQPAQRAEAIAATVLRVDAAVGGLSLAAQKEVRELFTLISIKPLRWMLTGIGDWAAATPEQLAQFLQSWRTHRIGLLQVGYHGLHDLIAGSFYSAPSAWPHADYSLPKAFQA
jgi:hypothetical protein